jgi:hypothetical protein
MIIVYNFDINLRSQMMFNYAKARVLLFLLFFIGCSSYGFSQEKIDCGNVHLTISAFKEDAPHSPRNILISAGVLKPIHLSDAALELRFFYETVTQVRTFVIKCTADSIYADRYTTFFFTLKEPPHIKGTKYKSLGYIDSLKMSAAYKKESFHTPPGVSWQVFLDSLIVKNHLFELPDQVELDKVGRLKLVLRNGKYATGLIRYEISINGHSRSFAQYKVYAYDENHIIPAVSFYKKINNLIQSLIYSNEKIN